MSDIKEQIFKEFAEKWNIHFEQVKYIHWCAENVGSKYGKTSRILKAQGIIIKPRQIKYFMRKVHLHIRLKGNRPKNYNQLLRNEDYGKDY